MVQFLKELGMSIEVHRDHFSPEEDDHVWIPVCVERGWVIISGDQGLEKTALNVRAVTESAAKVFILTDSNSPGLLWAASIITGRHKILRLISSNDGPFYVTVGHGQDTHVGSVRFVGHGKPKDKEAISAESIAVPQETAINPNPALEPKLKPSLFD